MTLLFVKFALAAILVVAGLGKLADPAGSRKSMVEFGIPSKLAPTAATAVALCEIATAALLAIPGSTPAGALGALALFACFGGAVAINLALGRAPGCHCFGRLSSGPVGWSTVARNTMFATAAGYVAADGR